MNGEIFFIQLQYVGRYIDLDKVKSKFSGVRHSIIFDTKDTPTSIYIPQPLILDIAELNQPELSPFKFITLRAKFYEDGVISLIARLTFEIPFEKLYLIKKTPFQTPDGEFNVDSWTNFHFKKIYADVEEFIESKSYAFDVPELEEYTAFCLTDELEDPADFVQKNSAYLANLLISEDPSIPLHPTQITATLSHPFSFKSNDLCIFDFDRCLLVDPHQDYDDILLITELANYQLLQLRTLDRLLDKRLDIAEDDIRKIFFKSRNPLSKLSKILGDLLLIRYDALFIFENLENVSKIIGDYFLAQIYSHLGELYQLDRWSLSIRHRFEMLDNIYNMAKTQVTDRVLLYLEIVLTFVFLIEFILLILGIVKQA